MTPEGTDERDQGSSDWTKEKPSDVLLAAGLLRVIRERFNDIQPKGEQS